MPKSHDVEERSVDDTRLHEARLIVAEANPDAQRERHNHGDSQGLGTDEGAQREPDISCERFSLIVPTAVPRRQGSWP
jgi:hypothetical protein